MKLFTLKMNEGHPKWHNLFLWLIPTKRFDHIRVTILYKRLKNHAWVVSAETKSPSCSPDELKVALNALEAHLNPEQECVCREGGENCQAKEHWLKSEETLTK